MQKKINSWIESVTNTIVGFLVRLIIQWGVIVPLFSLKTNVTQDFIITIIFTLATLIRSYLLRRIFDRIK
jgi:hypothetical protein